MAELLSSQRVESAAKLLWGLVLLSLPVTTFPFIPGPLGRTLIKPLAIYPLALLLPMLLWMQWRSKRLRWPENSSILFAFLLFAVAASVLGALYAPLDLRGASYWERGVRGWLSLLFGLSFFLTAFWMNQSEEDLRHTLKWLYAGLALTLAWSLVQAVAVNTDLLAKDSIDRIQLFFSERGVQPRRVTGFAFEPAWLADQLVIFYMPWLFAAMMTRRPLSSRKWLEPVLFGGAALVLLFTYSRGGLLGAVVSVAVVLLLVGRGALGRGAAWLARPLSGAAEVRSRTRGLALRLGLLALAALLLFGTFSFLSQYDYFARLWQASREQSLTNYLIEINSAQRLAYAAAGYGVYERYPLSGVGLGASGLYLFDHYPEWSLSVPEVARQLSPDSHLIPNAKNLYVRLLAETGLPGFWLFVVFFGSFLAVIRAQWISGGAVLRYVAVAGLFIWVALAVRNLTQDSFTFPIMWVSLGIVAGLSPAFLTEPVERTT